MLGEMSRTTYVITLLLFLCLLSWKVSAQTVTLSVPSSDTDGSFSVGWTYSGSYGGYIELFEKVGASGVPAKILSTGLSTGSTGLVRSPGTYIYHIRFCYYPGVYPTCPSTPSKTITVLVPPTPEPTPAPDIDIDFESGVGVWTLSNNYWRRDASGTPSGGTGPSAAEQGSYYLYLETSSGAAYSAGASSILQSPNFSTDCKSLAFIYHAYGANIGILHVEISNGSGWESLWVFNGQQQKSNADDWARKKISLAEYPGTRKIRFRAVAAGGYRGDMAIDDIQLETGSGYSYFYDELGRLTSVGQPNCKKTEYTYDDADNRTEKVTN